MSRQHELAAARAGLTVWYELLDQNRLYRLLTEIAMGGPPLSQHWIKKAGTVRGLMADESGVTAIEYTLIAALIAMAFVAIITQIGDFVSTPFQTIAGKL
jgi:Flp pilus assembly pilin Flp